MRVIFGICIAIAGNAWLAAGLWARDQTADGERTVPRAFGAVIDCSAIALDAERLSCFDRTVATLSSASRAGEIVVVDRTTVREARRGIFGLTLPRLKLFGDDNDDEVTAIDGTITEVRMAKDGMPIFVLDDGGRWKQTEGRNVFAKAGQPIHVKRAAVGSFMANINNQPGVRVVRLVP